MDAIEKTLWMKKKHSSPWICKMMSFWTDKVIDLMTENVFYNLWLGRVWIVYMRPTGTPEPGGLFYYETLEFLKTGIQDKNVVGFDIVELCPEQGR